MITSVRIIRPPSAKHPQCYTHRLTVSPGPFANGRPSFADLRLNTQAQWDIELTRYVQQAAAHDITGECAHHFRTIADWLIAHNPAHRAEQEQNP